MDSLDEKPHLVAWYLPPRATEIDATPLKGEAHFTFRIQPSGRVDPCTIRLLTPVAPALELDARSQILNAIFAPPLRHGHAVYASHYQVIKYRVGS